MSRKQLAVVIAGDIPFLRSLIRMSLEDEGFEVVAEADNATDLLVKIMRKKPHLVLLDLSLAEYETIRLVEDILDIDPDIAIVAVAEHRFGEGEKVLSAGARAFLVKPFSMYDLVDIIRKVTPVGYY